MFAEKIDKKHFFPLRNMYNLHLVINEVFTVILRNGANGCIFDSKETFFCPFRLKNVCFNNRRFLININHVLDKKIYEWRNVSAW